MTASAAALFASQAPTPVQVDRLANEFLEREKKVDEAYRIAVAADEPYERMKEDLVCLVEELDPHTRKSRSSCTA